MMRLIIFLNIPLNLLAVSRSSETPLKRRGLPRRTWAERIPDPTTTAGNFCRRFSQTQFIFVMQAINRVRQAVWKQQEDNFLDHLGSERRLKRTGIRTTIESSTFLRWRSTTNRPQLELRIASKRWWAQT